jgi:hypothetical protein
MSQPIFQSLLEHSKSYSAFLAFAATLTSAVGAAAVKAWNERVARRRTQEAETRDLQKMSALDEDDELKVLKKRKTNDSAYVPDKTPTHVARQRVVMRIAEAISTRTEQLNSAKRSKSVANGLTWTNYILGGVLASSFVQETVSARWAGGLGVLVLIASLIKQQYHPEADADTASRKALQLTSLIRTSEDRLAILDAKTATTGDQSNEMIGLMQWLTQRLGEIETLQVIQPKPDNGHQA